MSYFNKKELPAKPEPAQEPETFQRMMRDVSDLRFSCAAEAEQRFWQASGYKVQSVGHFGSRCWIYVADTAADVAKIAVFREKPILVTKGAWVFEDGSVFFPATDESGPRFKEDGREFARFISSFHPNMRRFKAAVEYILGQN